VKGGENMAVMLNMIPINQKQNIPLQTTKNKDGTKNSKSENGFAKVLTTETDKSDMDVDPKQNSNDTMQLMAAMAGMVVPVVAKLQLVEQVASNTTDRLAGIASPAPAQLASVVPVVLPVQLASVVPVVLPVQLASVVPDVPPVQLTSVVPDVPPAQLTSVVSDVPPAQLASVVPVVPPTQLASVVPDVPPTQLASVVPDVPPTQLASVVPDVPPTQLASVVSSDIKLATVSPQQTVVATQVENTQLSEFAKLQAQIQSKPILGQVQATELSTKNTDMLTNNAVVSNIIPSLTGMGNTNMLGKNTNKQSDGKKIVTSQINVEVGKVPNNFGLMESENVKPVLAPQVGVTVVDSLLGGKKENADASLPNQTVKNPDIFASMLNQQGMKIENQTMVKIKQGAPQQVSDPYNITTQIVDQARLVTGAKHTEMIIQLKPEHLGELTFKVTVENGILSASFHSNNAEVRSIIESSLSQLKQDLSNQGLKMDNIGVYAGLGQFSSNEQQPGGYQQPVIKVHNKKEEEDFLDIFESTDAVNRALDVAGVDYRA